MAAAPETTRTGEALVADGAVEAPALRVQNLRHAYHHPQRGTVQTIAGVTFDVTDREFVVVMGPSGCGKSTLLNIVAGFEAPVHGWVERGGKPIVGPGRDRGMVFQKPALYPWLNILQNVEFGLRATGRGDKARELALEMLKEVGLGGFEHHRPYELSGGMQHRAALARTLVNGPEVLLMDEPFAALDAQTRSEMQALLLEVWQRHRSTVLFVTHDIEEGLLLADRAIILSHRPARIRATIQVAFPRPRTYETVLDNEFVAMRRRVRALLQRGGKQ